MNPSTKEILRQLDEQYWSLEYMFSVESTDFTSLSMTVRYYHSIPWIVEALFACGFVHSQDLGSTQRYTHPDYPRFCVYIRSASDNQPGTYVTMDRTP